MQVILVSAVALHVLSGVFWAGWAFVLARIGGAGAQQLARPQMGAAALAVLSGGLLWHLVHGRSFQPQEELLALGALCAIVAAGVQGAAAARMRLARSSSAPPAGSLVLPQRVAAALLAVTVICMASAHYV